MSRRRRKSKPQIFSTSLLDMLFCAFGGVYTLFVIGSALLSGISIDMPMTLVAYFTSKSNIAPNTLQEKYLHDSYLTFGIDNEYKAENELDTNFLVHYGYLNPNFIEKSRASYLFLNSGVNQSENNFQVYAENLQLPLRTEINSFANDSIYVDLDLYIQGQLYAHDASSLFFVDEIYVNQLPSSKINSLTPLLQFSILADDSSIQFEIDR